MTKWVIVSEIHEKLRATENNFRQCNFVHLVKFLSQRVISMSANPTCKAIPYDEALLKTIVEKSGEGIFLADIDGNFVFVNRAICRITGYSEAEFTKMKASDVFPNETHVSVFPELAKGESEPGHIEFRKKDCTLSWAGIKTFPMELNDERLVLGIVSDITKEKLTEKEKRESENRYG